MRAWLLIVLFSAVARGDTPHSAVHARALSPCSFPYSALEERHALLSLKQWYSVHFARTNAEVEPLRLVGIQDWIDAPVRFPPDRFYGPTTLKDWQEADRALATTYRNAIPGPELLKAVHGIVTRNHYFAGYERRRIEREAAEGRLPPAEAEPLLVRIRNGEPLDFSGVPHASLAGTFRTEALDNFVHNGDRFLPDGRRYFTGDELSRFRNNRFLRVEETSVVKVGPDQFTGNVRMVEAAEIEARVGEAFAAFHDSLSKAQNDKDRLMSINRLSRDLITIHPFLDGNGRTVRLLTDWLYRRYGFPPRLINHESELTLSDAEDFRASVTGMLAYRSMVLSNSKLR
jgi:fido (protein-threonine AMPylation protein)